MRRRVNETIRITHLSENYAMGNSVYAVWGISPCICAASGMGGGNTPLLAVIERMG